MKHLVGLVGIVALGLAACQAPPTVQHFGGGGGVTPVEFQAYLTVAHTGHVTFTWDLGSDCEYTIEADHNADPIFGQIIKGAETGGPVRGTATVPAVGQRYSLRLDPVPDTGLGDSGSGPCWWKLDVTVTS